MIGRMLALSGRQVNPAQSWYLGGGAGVTNAGVYVDEEESLTLPALFRGVDNLASHLAMLPCHVYKRIGPQARERDPAHPVDKLLNRRANLEMTSFQFRKAQHVHAVLWGNGRAKYTYTDPNVLETLELLPQNAETCRDEVTEELFHLYRDDDGREHTVSDSETVRVTNLSSNGIVGYGLIEHLARQNIGKALALERYAQAFFGNNTILGAVLSAPNVLKKEVKEANLAAWNKARKGPNKAFAAVMMDGGYKVEQMRADNDKSQMIESATFNVQDVARWLNVPPPLLMELSDATYSNITELGRWYLIFCLTPWFVNYEQEYASKLLTAEEQDTHFVEFLADAVLRADIEKRYKAYATGIQNGIMSIDEVRAKENLNPLPDELGEKHYIQKNMKAIEDPEPEPQVQMQPAAPPEQPPQEEMRAAIASAHKPLFADVVARMDTKHGNAKRRRTFDAAKFYPEFAITFRGALIPAIEALAGTLRPTFPDSALADEWAAFSAQFTKEATGAYIATKRDGITRPLAAPESMVDTFVALAASTFNGTTRGVSRRMLAGVE